MLKALLINSFRSMIASMFRNGKNQKGKNGKRSAVTPVLFALLFIYAFGCFFFIFGSLFKTLCPALCEAGLSWLYFSVAAISSFLLCFIGSVFTAQKQLFEARDNELLLAMPIPPVYILVARMLMLYFLDMIFEIIIALPAIIVYFMYVPFTVPVLICIIIGFLLLPLGAMIFSCLIGWLLALISSKMRNKNIITMVFSLAFLGAYFYFYSQLDDLIVKLVENGSTIAQAIKRTLFPFYHFGLAASGGNFLSLLLFALCVIVPFGIMCLILARSFISIATANRGAAKKKYRKRELKQSSVIAAFTKKELRHFLSSPVYMLNTALGDLFAVAAAMVFLANYNAISRMIDQLPQMKMFTAPIIIVILCGLSSMNIVSAPSVSLEGKNLWIAQSMPVSGADVLMSKVYSHIVVCLPATLIASLSAAVYMLLFGMSPASALLVIILPALFTVFQALSGVWINIRFPRFDAPNETVAIKQSGASFFSMLASVAVLSLACIPYIIFIDRLSSEIATVSYICAVGVIIAVFDYIMYRLLRKFGDKIFASFTL